MKTVPDQHQQITTQFVIIIVHITLNAIKMKSLFDNYFYFNYSFIYGIFLLDSNLLLVTPKGHQSLMHSVTSYTVSYHTYSRSFVLTQSVLISKQNLETAAPSHTSYLIFSTGQQLIALRAESQTGDSSTVTPQKSLRLNAGVNGQIAQQPQSDGEII